MSLRSSSYSPMRYPRSRTPWSLVRYIGTDPLTVSSLALLNARGPYCLDPSHAHSPFSHRCLSKGPPTFVPSPAPSEIIVIKHIHHSSAARNARRRHRLRDVLLFPEGPDSLPSHPRGAQPTDDVVPDIPIERLAPSQFVARPPSPSESLASSQSDDDSTLPTDPIVLATAAVDLALCRGDADGYASALHDLESLRSHPIRRSYMFHFTRWLLWFLELASQPFEYLLLSLIVLVFGAYCLLVALLSLVLSIPSFLWKVSSPQVAYPPARVHPPTCPCLICAAPPTNYGALPTTVVRANIIRTPPRGNPPLPPPTGLPSAGLSSFFGGWISAIR
jgi:hypothetical protein